MSIFWGVWCVIEKGLFRVWHLRRGRVTRGWVVSRMNESGRNIFFEALAVRCMSLVWIVVDVRGHSLYLIAHIWNAQIQIWHNWSAQICTQLKCEDPNMHIFELRIYLKNVHNLRYWMPGTLKVPECREHSTVHHNESRHIWMRRDAKCALQHICCSLLHLECPFFSLKSQSII